MRTRAGCRLGLPSLLFLDLPRGRLPHRRAGRRPGDPDRAHHFPEGAPRAARQTRPAMLARQSVFKPCRGTFTFAHAKRGVPCVRPNLQPGREEDAPRPRVVRSSGRPRPPWGNHLTWAVPFHNGSALTPMPLAHDPAWSTHPAILGGNGSVASFGTPRESTLHRGGPAGRARSCTPPSASSTRLPAPARRPGVAHDLMRRIGRPARPRSFLTFVPPKEGVRPSGDAPPAATCWESWSGRLERPASGYGLEPRETLKTPGRRQRTDAVGRLVTSPTGTQIPSSKSPCAASSPPDAPGHAGSPTPVLITWNNVVVEQAKSLSGEGFASADSAETASRHLHQSGSPPRLLPPLVHSVILNGGYRCASNHLRASGERPA